MSSGCCRNFKCREIRIDPIHSLQEFHQSIHKSNVLGHNLLTPDIETHMDPVAVVAVVAVTDTSMCSWDLCKYKYQLGRYYLSHCFLAN
jgi:hypothetical protein